MRKSTFLLAALSAAGLMSSAWFAYQWRMQSRRIVDLEHELATGPAARATVARGDESAASIRTPKTATGNEAVASPGPTMRSAPAAGMNEDVAAYLRRAQQREREMLKDPEYRQTQIAAGRRQFAQMRADAIRVAGMTTDQADRIVDLWVERNLRYTELGGFAGELPTDENQAKLDRASAAEQTELRRLLGAETYQKWNRYLASGDERAEVGQLRAQLSNSETPLTDPQADALVEAIYSERERRSAEYEEYVKAAGITDRNVVAPQDRQRWLDLEKQANQRIHRAMAATLSESQLSSLDESLEARLAPVELELRRQLQGQSAKPE
jgi:hypothetical protein